jgi:hypothetical protein
MMQEGNTGHMPPTVWAEWRLWLYSPAPSEDILGQAGPSGAGLITELKPITHGGSTAFGNPSFRVVPCPGSAAALDSVEARRCVFVSFFAFGEGAAQVRAALQQRPPPPPPDSGVQFDWDFPMQGSVLALSRKLRRAMDRRPRARLGSLPL